MSSNRPFRMVAVLALLVSGCSSPQPEREPAVATLQSPAAPSSRPADQRPVFPFDATDDDKRAMTKPWVECLVREGGAKYRGYGDVLILKGGVEQADAVVKACEGKQPESFEQHQQRTDLSAFRDNQREWYRCAEREGYKLTPPDPDTGRFGLTEVGPNGDFTSAKMQECRRKSFTG